MTMYETAQQYHEAGFCVVPLSPKGKRACIPWKEYQQRRPDASERLAFFHEHPERNLAVVCGAVSGNLVVIDFDSKRAYQDWARQHVKLVCSTLISKTSKGYHVWFRTQEPTKTGTFDGGEIKAEGGYVVAPPSVHPDGPLYQFINGKTLEDIALIGSIHDLHLPAEQMRTPIEVEGILPEGARNQTLTSIAGTLRRRGLGYTEILATLQAVNAKRCEPLLSLGEIESIAQSILQYQPEEVLGQEPEAEVEAEGWQIYSLADAYTPRPPISYIVNGLFALPSLSIVYGPPGSFKTMLLADLAVCVASGHDWLPPLPGRRDCAARGTLIFPVLWCDFDNGPYRMHERIEATAKARQLSEDTPLYYVSMPSPWLDATDWDSMGELASIAQGLQAKLIIVDNLRDVSGGADENSAVMGDIMSHFRRLAEDLEAAVILIHHQRKNMGLTSRAGDALRGHSSIEAALDLALLIVREEHAESITVQPTKVRGEDVMPFGAQFTYEHKLGTKELALVKFYGLAVEDVSSDRAIKRTVLEAVQLQPEMNKGKLVGTVKDRMETVGVNRIRQIVDVLVSEGKVVASEPAQHNVRRYSLPTVKDHLDVSIV